MLKMCISFSINMQTISFFCSFLVGPQNTSINASPGNSLMEGHFLKLTCMTDSNPPAQVFWRKHLAKETIQHFIENSVLSIPHAHFTDSGQYICEVVNPVTNKTEKATTNIVIQGTSLLAFNYYSVTSLWLCIELKVAETLINRKLLGFPFMFSEFSFSS